MSPTTPPAAPGLYGLTTHAAPIDADGYTLDLEALDDLAHAVRPKIITVGGSLNLFPHPVAEVRKIADQVGAKVLFDAAHQCGIIAGRRLGQPADRRRASDDDEHLQDPSAAPPAA